MSAAARLDPPSGPWPGHLPREGGGTSWHGRLPTGLLGSCLGRHVEVRSTSASFQMNATLCATISLIVRTLGFGLDWLERRSFARLLPPAAFAWRARTRARMERIIMHLCFPES